MFGDQGSGGRKAQLPVDAQDLRAKAQRCRELLRIAARDEVRAQLRQWAEDFDAEAEAIEHTADRSELARSDRRR
jgi:hypothetical protein